MKDQISITRESRGFVLFLLKAHKHQAAEHVKREQSVATSAHWESEEANAQKAINEITEIPCTPTTAGNG